METFTKLGHPEFTQEMTAHPLPQSRPPGMHPKERKIDEHDAVLGPAWHKREVRAVNEEIIFRRNRSHEIEWKILNTAQFHSGKVNVESISNCGEVHRLMGDKRYVMLRGEHIRRHSRIPLRTSLSMQPPVVNAYVQFPTHA